MHQIFYLPEILLNVFGHCARPPVWVLEKQNHKYAADLASLARTCRRFKEPALDILWEELLDLSPLARCIPDACCSSGRCYSFSRPLKEMEWNTLRGYTRRVWSICSLSSVLGSLDHSAMRVVFALAPFADPLFPNLRSLRWEDLAAFPVVHAAVPLLTSLHIRTIRLPSDLLPTECLDLVGERCPRIKQLEVHSSPALLNTAISRQVCRWANLRYVNCPQVTLSLQAVLHLSSLSALTYLSFTLGTDLVPHFPSVCVFSNLAGLRIESTSQSITTFLSRVRLPTIKNLSVAFSNDVSKSDVHAYWATVQKACPFNTPTHLSLSSYGYHLEDFAGPDEQWHPELAVGDILPCKDFGHLRTIHIDLPWFVMLTDADLLDAVSTSPHLDRLVINESWGWGVDDGGGGITLSGVVQLLRRCPSLSSLGLAIATYTFTHIPPGLDVSFPQREAPWICLLDSYISPELTPALVLVFTALKLNPWALSAGTNEDGWDSEGEEAFRSLWENVFDEMKKRAPERRPSYW